ncbi:hypothetical protein N9M66_05605 [Litoreibacter sp.]|nr:hypothetical protein [Litoreibacter sp.]
MLFLKVIAAIAPVWFASSALADAGRMDRLTNSYLISDLEKDGVWQVSASEMRMDYNCLRCDGEVSAILEVIAPYTLEKFGSFEQKYTAERKVFCAHLAGQFSGRCIGTSATGMRGGALSGFRSTHEINDNSVTEIVFFYHNIYFGPVRGPEIIKATITSASNAEIPQGIAETLMWHMARLTIWW